MGTEKVHLTGDKETLLATLYGRAVHSRTEDPVLRDPLAQQAVERIDYDFSKLKIRATDALSVAIRAKTFDTLTAAHLARKPDTTVIHLACGLDTRAYRLDLPETVQWFDIDYPDIIALRERLFPPHPGDTTTHLDDTTTGPGEAITGPSEAVNARGEAETRARYTMIGLPATDPGWLERVPDDRPVLVVAEGLMMYLTTEEVHALLRRITNRFPSGEIVFDALSSLAVKLSRFQPAIRSTGATLRWGLDDPAELTADNPRLHLAEQLFFSDVPEVECFPAGYRAALAVMNRFYFLRKVGRILRYRF
ncbi:class I SAM-dependent methyltransferase [Sphaerisporangium flaviroseum]|uniref:Class I SAM-dependent methyltransferase n=1 Tax=Sphaerisporangium flaviroseum TaxID=509199 RepID=A0ABP7HZH3_9ACTN